MSITDLSSIEFVADHLNRLGISISKLQKSIYQKYRVFFETAWIAGWPDSILVA
jgi:hypothetical protein